MVKLKSHPHVINPKELTKKIVNNSKELAYSAGAFCIKKTLIENYDLNTKKEVGISTNTIDGLFEARHLYEKTLI